MLLSEVLYQKQLLPVTQHLHVGLDVDLVGVIMMFIIIKIIITLIMKSLLLLLLLLLLIIIIITKIVIIITYPSIIKPLTPTTLWSPTHSHHFPLLLPNIPSASSIDSPQYSLSHLCSLTLLVGLSLLCVFVFVRGVCLFELTKTINH